MSNVTIPNLPLAISLNGTEQLPAVQAGTSVRITTGQIAGLSGGVVGPTGPTGPLGPTGPAGAGSGPGGLDTQVQFNNGGVFGGSSMTYNSATQSFVVPAPAAGSTALTVYAPARILAGPLPVAAVSLVGSDTGGGSARAMLNLKSTSAAAQNFLISTDYTGFHISDANSLNEFISYYPGAGFGLSGDGTNPFTLSGPRVTVRWVTGQTPEALSYISIFTAPFAAGDRAMINDCEIDPTGNFGAIISGGGSYTSPVWFDGVNWRIG